MKRKLWIPLAGLILMALLATLPAFKCSEDPQKFSTVPEGFVDTPTRHFPFRAVAPDGTTIGVKERPNNEEGSLDYWREVFELEMVEGKGYKLTHTTDVTSKDGVPGKLMSFEVAHNETPFVYQLALYVTDKTIITVEAGAELARIERYQDAFNQVRNNLEVSVSAFEKD